MALRTCFEIGEGRCIILSVRQVLQEHFGKNSPKVIEDFVQNRLIGFLKVLEFGVFAPREDAGPIFFDDNRIIWSVRQYIIIWNLKQGGSNVLEDSEVKVIKYFHFQVLFYSE